MIMLPAEYASGYLMVYHECVRPTFLPPGGQK